MHPSSEEKEEEEDCLTEKSKSLTENSPAATLNSAEFSRQSGNLIWQSDFLPSRVQTVFLPLSLSPSVGCSPGNSAFFAFMHRHVALVQD